MITSRPTDESLKDGDVLIELQNGDVADYIGKRSYKEMPINILHFIASHAMIYKAESQTDASILHSSPGNFLQGVKKNNFIHKLQKTTFYAGSFIVLRLKDEKLSSEMAAVALRWTQCKKIQTKDMEEKEQTTTRVIQATPYHSDRSADSSDVKDLFELYRAFRAYLRNMHEPTLPLSKTQGVSCDNFVFYCLKVAIIKQWFPENVLAKIKTELLAIEAIKAKEKITKLNEFKDNLGHFNRIREIAENFANTRLEHESEAEFQARSQAIKIIFAPVKAERIKDFVYLAVRCGLFDVKGYVYFQEKMTPETLAIMRHETLMNLKKIHTGRQLQPIVVSTEDLLTSAKLPMAEQQKQVGVQGFFRPQQIQVKSQSVLRIIFDL
ncbi:MAG: hypothetical protein ACYCQI_06565 [Gammaproteobacteria bacterium]